MLMCQFSVISDQGSVKLKVFCANYKGESRCARGELDSVQGESQATPSRGVLEVRWQYKIKRGEKIHP